MVHCGSGQYMWYSQGLAIGESNKEDRERPNSQYKKTKPAIYLIIKNKFAGLTDCSSYKVRQTNPKLSRKF